MTNDDGNDSLRSVPKLKIPSDFIPWHRKIEAYIQRNDPMLISLKPKPSNSSRSQAASEAVKKWETANAKAKGNIILCLGDTVASQVRLFVDDDEKSAGELWTELGRIFTMSNAQVIQNLKQKLDSLIYKDGESFQKHISSFLCIVGELAAYDSDLSEREKVTKLLRSLPNSFAPLSMVCGLQDFTFEKLVVTIQGEIARRTNPNNPQKDFKTSIEPQANFTAIKGGRGRGRGRGGRISRNSGRGAGQSGSTMQGRVDKRTCFYCKRRGHLIKDCWEKKNDDERNSESGNYSQANDTTLSRRHTRFDNTGPRNYDALPRSSQRPIDSGNGWNGTDLNRDVRGNNNYPSSRFARAPENGDEPKGFIIWLDTDNETEFKSNAATLSKKKTSSAYIDSGATHHFFYSRKLFINYTRIPAKTVKAASGTAKLVGKGEIHIPLAGGMIIEAYHAPNFSSNILSVGMLSSSFIVTFTDIIREHKACFLMDRKTWDIVWETPQENGLYKMNMGDNEAPTSMAARANPDKSFVLEWHGRTGHLGVERYIKLSQLLESVPFIDRNTLQNLNFVPCLKGKARRAPIHKSTLQTFHPLHLVHIDISRPVEPTLAGNKYTLAILDDYTAKSDVFLLLNRDETYMKLEWYRNRSQTIFNGMLRLQNIKLDRAGENRGEDVQKFAHRFGIKLDFSPSHASESNGAAERLIQEHWYRARVLLMASDLPKSLWGEDINHANWLRNRTPSSRVNGNIPILLWDEKTRVDFTKVPEFGQKGHAFVYRSKTVAKKKLLPRTVAKKKLLPRTVFGHFVGMESDITLFRVYLPITGKILIARAQDFTPQWSTELPNLSSFMDGISRQMELEVLGGNLDSVPTLDDDNDEEQLTSVLSAATTFEPKVFISNKSLSDSRLPRSFGQACQDPDWAAAIDREFNALVERGTWNLVRRTPEMKPVPFLWTFRLKKLESQSYLHKARCCIRGDKQKPFVDFDPDNTYAPVAAHETLRILLAFAAGHNLELEGADISNAYLYGKLDIPIIMEQPTNSTMVLEKPGLVAEVVGSMYGTRQAGEIWGSLLDNVLKSWNFKTSKFDARLYMFKDDEQFMLVAIVVDDIAFASNSTSHMNLFKQKLSAKFKVRMFGNLKSFIGWQINRENGKLKVTQEAYAKDLLRSFGMEDANAVGTPLPLNTDISPAQENEDLLTTKEHSRYRSAIGGLLYMAVSTRPDLSFPVSALARHLHAPTPRHAALLKRTFRYLVGTISFGLNFKCDTQVCPSNLVACVDADWGGCSETRRSTTGFVIAIHGAPVYWKSKRQTVIALSSAESEYIALSSCTKEVSWIRKLFWEICRAIPWNEETQYSATAVLMDSTAAQSLAMNATVSARNKHIDLKVHHVRDLLKKCVLNLVHVDSKEQPADLLTKIMSRMTLRKMIHLLHLSE